jgi:hypothetical protein
MIQAHPLDAPDDSAGTKEKYLMACTVSGASSLVLIAWRARDLEHAEATFQAWLDQGWAVLNRTFFNEPSRYVFRTAAVTGFVVLPD